ncbi:POTRA domain-containing protein [Niabella insulamsoli]|uniref:POTRA domain-containing protein n=1 Tax=Niabella insulamsoli TaxID=3144874 RepID=UPI0031FCD0B5
MPWLKKYLLWLLLSTGSFLSVCGQIDSTGLSVVDSAKTPSPTGSNNFLVDSIIRLYPDSSIVVRHINFIGNKKTRRVIMLRELPFAEGDSIKISEMPALLSQAKRQLLNLSLFLIKDFDIAVTSNRAPFVDITIKVKERWYLLPLPHLKPIDRNLNEWLFERGASASRLDYGVKLMYDNATGNNDKLRFYFVTGYTKQLLLSYNRPYIDKNLKWGMNMSLALGKTHEINYGTGRVGDSANRQLFYSDRNGYPRNFFEGAVELFYRPAFFTRHVFGLGYNTLRVADSVILKNPYYLNHGATSLKYPEIYYKLIYQNLDYIPYPTKGYAGEIYLLKQGFNSKMNVWQLAVKGQGSWHLGQKLFYSISALGSIRVPFDQPYVNSQLLGYGDLNLRGYEPYVIDGVAGGIVNATLSKQLANFSLNLPLPKAIKKYTSTLIPLKIYGKVYGNMGYAHNPQPWAGSLSNRMLFGGGFGLDIFTDYDFTLKLEFSFNQLGQNGLYLHKKTLY